MRAWQWVKVARLYRSERYHDFLSAVAQFEKSNTLTVYQLSMRANALLMVGRYRDALSLFSIISGDANESGPDADYIRHYANAMICDINGDTEAFNRISRKASSIKVSHLVKLNLPLG